MHAKRPMSAPGSVRFRNPSTALVFTALALVPAVAACGGNDAAPVPAAATALTDAPATPPSMPPGHPTGPGAMPPGHPTGHPMGPGAMPPGHPTGPGTGAPSAAAEPAPTGAPQAGGLTWTAGAPLSRRAPASRMRAAEYLVPDDNQGSPTLLTVYFFGPGQGGSVEANLDRWIGQISQPDGKPSRDVAKIETRRAGTIEITVLDVAGTYGGGMMGGGGAAADQRMLAAAAKGPEGPVFFKLVGPASTVAGARDAFLALLDSITPAG